MELWIRSQDRESLLKVEKMFYFNTCPEMESAGRNVILNKEWIGEKDCIELGEYATKERALEVLDEIQKILKPQLIIKNSGKIIGAFEDTIIREGATYETKELATYVYEMPKE